MNVGIIIASLGNVLSTHGSYLLSCSMKGMPSGEGPLDVGWVFCLLLCAKCHRLLDSSGCSALLGVVFSVDLKKASRTPLSLRWIQGGKFCRDSQVLLILSWHFPSRTALPLETWTPSNMDWYSWPPSYSQHNAHIFHSPSIQEDGKPFFPQAEHSFQTDNHFFLD